MKPISVNSVMAFRSMPTLRIQMFSVDPRMYSGRPEAKPMAMQSATRLLRKASTKALI